MSKAKSGNGVDGRAVTAVVPAQRTLEGEGFEVRRAIPGPGFQSVGPFIMFDHFGPKDYGPGEALGAPEHPHFGIETLTYMFEGFGLHRDSIGNISITGPLEAQWMRAGRGIVHDEGADPEARRLGGRSHGVQLWINLPKGHRDAAPEYKPYRAEDIPELPVDGGVVRLLAGTLGAETGPVTSFSPPWLAHVSLAAGTSLHLAAPNGIDLGAYVVSGSGKFGSPDRSANEGDLVRFARDGEGVRIQAVTALDLLVLGGPPVEGQLLRYGPFVADTKEELLRAVRDYQTGAMGSIDFSKPIPPRPAPREKAKEVAAAR
jgi:redox-sensitive bicupin YhaK (pirin superfamily)